MSISIGKTPRYEVSDIALTIYTNASNLLKLTSEQSQNNIQFRDFKLGQQNTYPKSLHLYHSNVLLTQWNSNQLQFLQISQFQSNLTVSKDLTSQSNLISLNLDTSNLQIQYISGSPLKIYDSTQNIVLELNSVGDLKYMGNIGIGITESQYALDVIGSAYIHSNIYNGYTNASINASNIYVNEIRSLTYNLQNYLLLKNNSIEFNAPEVIVSNPTLLGTITYDGTISLQQSIINTLSSCNIRVINKSLNNHGVYIKQLNPSFGLTSNHNAIHIDSYFSSVDRTLPIFVVDSFGRISSGRYTSNLPSTDALFSYEIDDSRAVYLSGFMNLSTCNVLEKTIIDKKGHIGIGTSSTQHFLQITNPYTSYESYYQRPSSLIGLYQTTSNAKPYMLLYNCNEAICFQINSNGDLLFQPHKTYDDRYRFEVTSNAYIRYVHADQLYSSTGVVNFTQSYLSNMNQLISNKIYVQQGGSLSNIFITGLTVDDINIGAFDYINIPSTNYEEFRIATTRLLYIGSNFVMNPNQYFFEIEQSNLTNDKIRIYANGGPTEEINVLHTIANNRTSTFNITNCNTILNTSAQIQFDANKNIYQFGVLNTGDFYGEGYITCNVDVTDANREMTFTNDGTRVGTKIHLSKVGRVTLNDTTAGIHTLAMNGELEVISESTGASNFIITSQGNVGFGTNIPRTFVDINASNVLLFGNLGVGVLTPSYAMDVSGTLNAKRVLGVKYADLRGGAFNQWVLADTGIYFNELSCNIGIGTTAPSASIHVHTSNHRGPSFGSYIQDNYNLFWPPVPLALSTPSSNFTLVASNVLYTSNLRFPPAYLTSASTSISASSVLYGSGTYTASASSEDTGGVNAWRAFDNSTNTVWRTADATSTRYNTAGTYTGTNSFETIKGEWIQIDMPTFFVPSTYVIQGLAYGYRDGGTSLSYASPRGWRLFGACNSGGPWTQLQVASNAIVTSTAYTFTSNVYTSQPYSSYAFVIEQVNISGTVTTNQNVQIPNIWFNEAPNKRNLQVGYTSNYILSSSYSNVLPYSQARYHTGNYKVSVSPVHYTSNYTYTPYSFTIGVPLHVTSLSSTIQVSDPSELLKPGSTTPFTTNNQFTSGSDTNPPLSITITYPTTYHPIKTYSITCATDPNLAPRKWNLYGSNQVYNNWVLLDQQDAITWTANQEQTFVLSQPSSNNFYRYDFLRNNSATLSALSIQTIMASNLGQAVLVPTMEYTPSYNQLKISGGIVVGYNSTSNQYLAPKDSLIVDGFIGIGTTYPIRSLQVQRDAKFTENTSNDTNVYVGTNYDVFISTKITNSNVLVRSGNYETIQTSLAEGYSNIAYFPPTGMVRNSAITSNGIIIEWNDINTNGQEALAGLSNVVLSQLGYYHGFVINTNGTMTDNVITYYTQITVPVSLSNIVSTASQIHKFELTGDGRYGGGSLYFSGFYDDFTYKQAIIENRIYSKGTQKSELLIFKGTEPSIFDSQTWTSVCWSPELAIYVAVGFDGVIGTSINGLKWDTRVLGGYENEYWTSIIWSSERSLFVIVGWSSYILTSPDGNTWTASSVPYNIWNSVAWSPTLSLFVAVSWGRILTSSNGTTWAQISAPVDNIWQSICWSPELSLFVAVAYGGGATNRVMTSSNGSTWTLQTTPGNTWQSVCWAAELGLFVAVASSGTNDRVMTSTDGITWTSRTSAIDNDWFSVVWASQLNLLVAVAYSYTGGANKVMTSTNGITWTASTELNTSKWRSVCWSPQQQKLVAVAGEGNVRAMVSINATQWDTIPANLKETIRMRAGRIAMDVYSTATTNRNAENIRGYVTNTGIYGLTNITTSNLQINSIADTNGIYMLQRNIYDTPGEITITKPTNLQYSYARIQMWGAGGGGAGANYQALVNNGVGNFRPGGGGGGGGAYGEITIPWHIIANSTLTANVGYGGTGGIGGYIATTTAITGTTNSETAGVGRAATAGIDGTSTRLSLSITAGNSTLNANWYANGGTGGKVGVGTNGGQNGAGGTILGTFDISQSGTNGGDGGGTAGAGGLPGVNLTTTGFAATGGGGGGGLPDVLPAPYFGRIGGNSGSGCIPAAYLSGTAAKALGEQVDNTVTYRIEAQSGYTIYDTYGGGTGGGAGGGYASTIAGGLAIANPGKDGGWPGGGGGGGGTAKQHFPNTGYSGYGASVTAGYGGNGGNGAIIITYY